MATTTTTKNQQKSYQDDLGNPIILGKELARGGEGKVCLVKGNDDVVAKIYLDKALQKHNKADKIKAMCNLFDPDVATFSALPQKAVFNSNGEIVGFIMEKITDFKEIHKLYGISTKRKLFDLADWGFMVHAAQNLAIAVNKLHSKNIIIGDINQGNILVDNQAMIKLIDCDSYQVKHNGKIYFCEVGVPEYTSPELQGMSFNGITRSKNHDCFGLAVMIFKILMFGRHPYSGVGAPSEIGDAIKQGFYCFGHNTKNATPIYSKLASEILNDEIKELFERAFSKTQYYARPTAIEWQKALKNFEKKLQKCSQGHKYYSKNRACVWCELAKKGFKPFNNIPVKPNNTPTNYQQTPYVQSNINTPTAAQTPNPTPKPSTKPIPKPAKTPTPFPTSTQTPTPAQTYPSQPTQTQISNSNLQQPKNAIQQFVDEHPYITSIIIIGCIILAIHAQDNNVNTTNSNNQENYQVQQPQKTYTEAQKKADLDAFKQMLLQDLNQNYPKEKRPDNPIEAGVEIYKNGAMNINAFSETVEKESLHLYEATRIALLNTFHPGREEAYPPGYREPLPESYDKDNLILNFVFTKSGIYYKGTEPKEEIQKTTPQQELINYKKDVISKIKKYWVENYPETKGEAIIEITFVNPSVSGYKTVKAISSTDDETFNNASSSIDFSGYWDAFPESYNKQTITMRLKFTKGNITLLDNSNSTNTQAKPKQKNADVSNTTKPSPKTESKPQIKEPQQKPAPPKTDLQKSTDYFFE